MTPVLLDTNAYLRLAKRIRPLLGIPFGQKRYVLTILNQVEDEVRKNPRLKFSFPWFTDADLSAERLSVTSPAKPGGARQHCARSRRRHGGGW